MCLTRIETTYNQPSDLIVDGWKEFRGVGLLKTSVQGTTVPLDRWIPAVPKDILADDGKTYMAGFHAYTDENHKPRSASRRVYLRKITCTGIQDASKCAVAQEIFVPSDPAAWPPQETTPPKKKLMDRIRKR